MTYTVIKDTREQQGWYFSQSLYCDGMEIGTLKTGDYTIKDTENLICIERKGSVTEIAGNLGKNYKVFSKEIERMAAFKHAFIVCEFGMTELINYPTLSKLPPWTRNKIRVTGAFLLRRLLEIQINTNVKVIFCDSQINAYEVVDSIFKRIGESLD